MLTEKAFENAMRVLLAIGGSTNAIVHLTAIAGRMGFEVDLKALDRMGRETPVLLDLKPSGQHYMEHFHAAGGMATLLRELKPLLHLDALTVTGRTLGEELERAQASVQAGRGAHARQPDLSARRHRRAARQPGARRRDHQAVGGGPKLMEHEGRAVVFEGLEDWRIAWTATTSTCARRRAGAEEHRPEGRARHAGSRLHPAAAQAGAAGREGHGADLRRPHERHRFRHHRAARDPGIGDRRPAGAGAQRRPHPPVVSKREISLLVSDEALARRTREQPVQEPSAERGYRKLFLATVTQADQGVDFDFLAAAEMRGRVPRT
jgi:dihydroxy-acid dehydratase